MRQQDYKSTRQGELVLGLGRFKVEGLKFFFEKKGKRRKDECWSLWWEEFLIVLIVAMGINFLMLIA